MEFSIGNRKLGHDTAIINVTSATSCPSRTLGLCSIGNKCYAMKAERLYPGCRPFRDRQSSAWDSETPQQIVDSIMEAVERSRRLYGPGMPRADPSKVIKYVRLSEAGDFKNQTDVDKANTIAALLGAEGITMYGYTARRDLDFTQVKLNPHFVMQGTKFMIDNEFNPTTDPALLDPTTSAAGAEICDGKCPTCNKCKVKNNKVIYIKIH